MSLSDKALDDLPHLAHSRRGALVVDVAVGASGELRDGALDEAALCEARAEEDGVHDQEDPGAFLEDECSAEDPKPEGDFEERDERHARVVVVFNESSDRV